MQLLTGSPAMDRAHLNVAAITYRDVVGGTGVKGVIVYSVVALISCTSQVASGQPILVLGGCQT